MGAVVTHSPVTAVRRVERIAVGLRQGEPGEVLADLRCVGAARLRGQRAGGQGDDVDLEHGRERLGQLERGATPTPWHDRHRVL